MDSCYWYKSKRLGSLVLDQPLPPRLPDLAGTNVWIEIYLLGDLEFLREPLLSDSDGFGDLVRVRALTLSCRLLSAGSPTDDLCNGGGPRLCGDTLGCVVLIIL